MIMWKSNAVSLVLPQTVTRAPDKSQFTHYSLPTLWETLCIIRFSLYRLNCPCAVWIRTKNLDVLGGGLLDPVLTLDPATEWDLYDLSGDKIH